MMTKSYPLAIHWGGVRLSRLQEVLWRQKAQHRLTIWRGSKVRLHLCGRTVYKNAEDWVHQKDHCPAWHWVYEKWSIIFCDMVQLLPSASGIEWHVSDWAVLRETETETSIQSKRPGRGNRWSVRVLLQRQTASAVSQPPKISLGSIINRSLRYGDSAHTLHALSSNLTVRSYFLHDFKEHFIKSLTCNINFQENRTKKCRQTATTEFAGPIQGSYLVKSAQYAVSPPRPQGSMWSTEPFVGQS